MRALMAGDLSRAGALIEAAATSARESGEPDGAVVALNQRFELPRGERRPKSAASDPRTVFARYRVIRRSQPVWRWPASTPTITTARGLRSRRTKTCRSTASSPSTARPGSCRCSATSSSGWARSMRFAGRWPRCCPSRARTSSPAVGVLYRGAVDHHLGVLLVAAGDGDAGVAHLRAALEMHQRLGAAPWASRTARALASVDALPEIDVPPLAGNGGAQSSMVRDGDVWTLSYATTSLRCKDSKGLRDLAMLLANPRVEIRATVLAGVPDRDASAGDVLDERARKEIAAPASRPRHRHRPR